MFATPGIRTSYIKTIVDWVEKSYDIHEVSQIKYITESLTALSDEKLREAGSEIEAFEKESKDTLAHLDRQLLSIEHSFEEEKERSEIETPLFS